MGRGPLPGPRRYSWVSSEIGSSVFNLRSAIQAPDEDRCDEHDHDEADDDRDPYPRVNFPFRAHGDERTHREEEEPYAYDGDEDRRQSGDTGIIYRTC